MPSGGWRGGTVTDVEMLLFVIAVLLLAILIDARCRHKEAARWAHGIGNMVNEIADLAARCAPDEAGEAKEKGADHVRRD